MPNYQKYLDYIKNAGGSPKVEWFEDDFEPVGATVISDMVKAGLVEITGDRRLIIKSAI